MSILTGVDGTGPPTGDRPRRSIAAGRADRRPRDRRLDKGKGHVSIPT